jgi:DNA-binding SARP family transcriptional activator
VPIGSEKQRALLAFLALRPQRLVTNDALVDGLWGDDPPDGAVKALRFHVSRLRGILRQADAADTLRTRPGGYLLAVAEDAVDVVRFERSVAAARLARSDGAAPDAVSSALRDALALWAGPALADVNAEPFVAGERRRLEELRLVATEDYFAAELAGGRDAEAVGELERMVDSQPLRERLWELLITALYRSEQEVFHLFELPAGPYPRGSAGASVRTRTVHGAFRGVRRCPPERSGLNFVYVWPSRATWGECIRKGGCALFDAVGGDLTGSMAGTRR